MKIIHFTTVHSRADTRIRIKMASSLAAHFNETVALYVQDGMGDEFDTVRNVQVVDTGYVRGGRLARVTFGAWRMYRAVRCAKPKIAHFHDPELISVGMLLKLSGIKVLYDIHEDVPRQILAKHWITPWLRRPVSWVVESIEWIAVRMLDGVVAATYTISQRFPAHKTVTVQNFPILDELVASEPVPYANRPPHIAYVGGISVIRGAKEMVKALSCVSFGGDVKLQLAGTFMPTDLEQELQSMEGWDRVLPHGWADRTTITAIFSQVRAGLVVLHPTVNYSDAMPVKMFEYMAAGLPVIASDFPLWRQIVCDANCGLLVDPLDPKAVAEAIDYLIIHPKEAEQMGLNGLRAVQEKYNWAVEVRKLLELYGQVV